MSLHPDDWDSDSRLIAPPDSDEEEILSAEFRRWTTRNWRGAKSQIDKTVSELVGITKSRDHTRRRKKFESTISLVRSRLEDFRFHKDGRGQARLDGFQRFSEAVRAEFLD